jgi:hypothetical protein
MRTISTAQESTPGPMAASTSESGSGTGCTGRGSSYGQMDDRL